MDRGAWQATVLESDLTERTEHKHNTKLCDAANGVLIGKFIVANASIKKKKKPQVDNLTLDLKELGK